MYKLPFIIILFYCVNLFAQNPHGESLKIDCVNCHAPEVWNEILPKLDFNHQAESGFELDGQHEQLKCTNCHIDLEFSKSSDKCDTCHLDLHETTVGNDCARCHNSQSWLVNNIYEIHQYTRFPLNGPHQTASCINCHTGMSNLSFPPVSVNCIDCHRENYQSEQWHVTSNISIDCQECHLENNWYQAQFNHDVTSFTLTPSHVPLACTDCHLNQTNYKEYSCISCHTHNKQITDEQHIRVHHYKYVSSACRMCHPAHENHHGKY